MTKLNILVPVVCVNTARITVDIADDLLPKLKKLIGTNPDINWSIVEGFLSDNDVENDEDDESLIDAIAEASNDFDASDLYWEVDDNLKVDFETTDDYESLDTTRDWVMQALSAVQESGCTNMFDRKEIVNVAKDLDFEDAAVTLDSLSDKEFLRYLQELPDWQSLEV